MPLERKYNEKDWDIKKIRKVNSGLNGNGNKRIEIVLNFKELNK
jgi:hypothetical protein